jgi:hypothetical protein
MGLFNKIFSKKNNYLGDLSKTEVLSELFEVPGENRNDAWENSFFENIGNASFRCGDPQVIMGPDGFPYFQLLMPVAYQPFTCHVVDHLVKDYLLENGFGIVVNPDKGNPDWVFSYGDVLNYFLNEEFYSSKSEVQLPEHEVLEKEVQVLIGQPSESLLPNYTRVVIRNALNKIGIKNVKIFLMHRSDRDFQELVFNITPTKLNNNELFSLANRIISWYLPRHYSVCGMDEESNKNNFAEL